MRGNRISSRLQTAVDRLKTLNNNTVSDPLKNGDLVLSNQPTDCIVKQQ